ncbi:MAG: glycine cleavage system aminomethyltransferase GcvT [Candidatus Thermoplasmatota archaeon]|nr:glycine cleavage system aminomethyltransferase GcvT [Candidatus Thermoplasmatota archaeon]MBS3790087.1 glycine cleavage system aminomethyltransferase GcvT [Candidatus Thermoplasmatota archaeon]
MKETALHSKHAEAEARMTNFGGYEMPLKFTSINKEHKAVREAAGIFDVSHMGEILLEGDGAIEFISEHCTMNIVESDINQLKYAHILNEDGGILDDTIVTKLSEDACYIVPNVGNNERICNWFAERGGKEYIEDLTEETSMFALQGPDAEKVLQELTDEDLSEIDFFQAKQMEINDEIMEEFSSEWPMCDTPIVQRSGYTGEDGFEIALPNEAAIVLWEQLQDLEDSPTRCGLGARDTLRIEFGFLLAQQDFDESRTTIETGWAEDAVNWDHEFVGKEKLEEMKDTDHQLLKGFEMEDKGIPRHGYEILDDDEKIGEVTSGTRSPTLKKGIGLGYLDPGYHEEGTEIMIEIRDEKRKAIIKNPPFV